MMRVAPSLGLAALLLFTSAGASANDSDGSDAAPSSAPAVHWSFEGANDAARLTSRPVEGQQFTLEERGSIELGVPGPRPSEYPDFDPANLAARLPGKSSFLALKDPGEKSLLDFDNGDALTLECWVRWEDPLNGAYQYLIGKGRTHQGKGTTYNQNYALRLAPTGSGVCPNFLFTDAVNAAKPGAGNEQWHRWTASEGIPEDGGWHHVAVTYVFGEPDSLRGYIDGRPVKGTWDYGGKTTHPPVVDNDELWIGSSMGGGQSFNGFIDEAAIHRRALTEDEIKAKVRIDIEQSGFAIGKVDAEQVPTDHVRVEVLEGVPVARSWQFRVRGFEPLYETDVFALKELPRKYNGKGLAIDRRIPMLVHLSTKLEVPAGDYEFIVRSLDSSRLYIDGELHAETAFMGLNGSAHGPYYELPKFGPELLSIAAGHSEKRVTVKLSEGSHVVSLYRLVGNKGKSDYLGEVSVGYGPPGGPYQFVGAGREQPLPFTDDGWLTFLAEDELRLREFEQDLRLAGGEDEAAYWRQRHEYARQHAPVAAEPPAAAPESKAASAIDRFLQARHWEEPIAPMPIADDFTFLRRVTLDLAGQIPTPAEINAYFADPAETRRSRAIERLLADPRWADHWVGYWQDVLAENPGLTKPELNNTGPFRWFLYESFLDNKPIDRFVTELTMMEGSYRDGATAGFEVASQNDVPMAAKAHVLGTAFLGVEMKCARCHDAPNHDLSQQDLFSLAAMLKRGPQSVPKTSSVPVDPELLEQMEVKVTLPPGSSVKPDWPFVEFVSLVGDKSQETRDKSESGLPLPAELIRDVKDSRELLAAQMTSPHNARFAKVMANRVWRRYMGRGIVEPVEDWEGASASHPELLDWLAREFVTHGYDLKHLARLILNSDAYQRMAVPESYTSSQAAQFAGPVRRRMTGEQIVDSLYLAAGKDFGSEELTMDRDGRQSGRAFLHLRYPRRSWQLVTVSNERDRPSLNLPVAQSLVDLLSAYGWRQQRQDPLTVREDALTPLQPMALANGTAANRAIDLSDDSAVTALALQEQPLPEFVEKLFQRLLTRPPTTEEREALVELLAPGYEDRVIAGPEAVPPRRIVRSGVTWTNHFDPKSDNELMARQREILKGDPPSVRLDADWRTRAEDAVWALVNLPEFVFVP